MKPLIAFLCLLVAGVGFAQELKTVTEQQLEEMASPYRFVQCKREEATFALTLVCSPDGIFKEKKRLFYFRPVRGMADMNLPENSMTNADGSDGTGYGFSVYAWAKDTAVELAVKVYWTTKTAHGNSDITLLVPYFGDKKGKDAGFDYSATWQELNQKKEVATEKNSVSRRESQKPPLLTELASKYSQAVKQVSAQLKKEGEEPAEFHATIEEKAGGKILVFSLIHKDTYVIREKKNVRGNPSGKDRSISYDVQTGVASRSLFYQ